MSTHTLFLLLILFFATLVRSTFGFGEALIAVPLLALVIPITEAAPLAVLLSTTIALIVVVQDWRRIHLRSALWLLAPTFLGIPLGTALLASSHQAVVKGLLAVTLIAFSAYVLLRAQMPRLHRDRRSWMLTCGLLAGVLGGAYGMNGPPLVLYGSMRGWSPQHFRATLQGYFLPASAAAMVAFWAAGLWTRTVTHDYLITLPAAVPAIFLGRAINHRLRGDAFLKAIYIGLLGLGILLLAQALRRI